MSTDLRERAKEVRLEPAREASVVRTRDGIALGVRLSIDASELRALGVDVDGATKVRFAVRDGKAVFW